MSIDFVVEWVVLKVKCECDYLFFSWYFFKYWQGIKFCVNWYYVLIVDMVQCVIDGELKNVVINVLLGLLKIEFVVINFIVCGFVFNLCVFFVYFLF